MTSELKPCPFCGCDELELNMKRYSFSMSNKHYGATYSCSSCGAIVTGVEPSDDPNEAIMFAREAWNRRAKPEDLARVAKLVHE